MGGGMRKMLRRIGSWAADGLFPRGACCLCCGDPRRADEEDGLCDKCRGRLEELRVPASACERCLSPVKKGERCAFCKSPAMRDVGAVYAPYRYQAEARRLVHAFKFHSCGEAGTLLGRETADALRDTDFDWIVPVPLHPRRLRRRGFNQALLLGAEISRRTGIPVRDVLRRDRYVKPQSRMPFGKRQKNVAGAFSCGEDLTGKRILLVDDVRTSGSTAADCARALKEAGAGKVCLAVSAVVYRRSQ